MIESIEFVHQKHFIHRDIKPENFVLDKKSLKVKYLFNYFLIFPSYI